MAIVTAATAALSSLASSGGAATAASSAASAAGSSGMMSSVMSFLGGSSGGFSNAGLLSAGTSLLSSITGARGASQEAKAMKKAQEEQWRQQMINVREQYSQLAGQQRAAAKQYHTEAISNQVNLLQQQSVVELMAGATGTQGSSVTSMLNDLAGDAGRNQAQIIENYSNEQQSFINMAKAIQTGGQMQMREFKKPSAISTIAGSLSKAAGAYLTGSQTGKALSESYFDSRKFTSGLGSR